MAQPRITDHLGYCRQGLEVESVVRKLSPEPQCHDPGAINVIVITE